MPRSWRRSLWRVCSLPPSEINVRGKTVKKFIVSERGTLKDFTDDHFAQGSFALSRLLRDKDVRVNGAKVSKNILLQAGDEIIYYTSIKEESRPFYSILYEDENVLIADKFAGVNASALFCALREELAVKFIHRLDRNTCGVIAFAKNERAEDALLAAFRERRAHKIYETVCFHPFQKRSALLTAYLKKDAQGARVKIYSAPQRGVDEIVTEYFDAENFGELSRVKVRLHSGKTHQIRAHLAFIGHPVAGDEKYGDEALNRKYRLKRHILVAKKLSFSLSGALSYLSGKVFLSSFSAELPILPQ